MTVVNAMSSMLSNVVVGDYSKIALRQTLGEGEPRLRLAE